MPGTDVVVWSPPKAVDGRPRPVWRPKAIGKAARHARHIEDAQQAPGAPPVTDSDWPTDYRGWPRGFQAGPCEWCGAPVVAVFAPHTQEHANNAVHCGTNHREAARRARRAATNPGQSASWDNYVAAREVRYAAHAREVAVGVMRRIRMGALDEAAQLIASQPDALRPHVEALTLAALLEARERSGALSARDAFKRMAPDALPAVDSAAVWAALGAPVTPRPPDTAARMATRWLDAATGPAVFEEAIARARGDKPAPPWEVERRTLCPTPTKRAYPRHPGGTAATRLHIEKLRHGRWGQDVHAYECAYEDGRGCGWLHVGKSRDHLEKRVAAVFAGVRRRARL